MISHKSQRYLLGLLLTSTLSANIQSVSALTTMPAHSSESGASMNQKISLVTAPITTVKPPVTTGLPMMMASEEQQNIKGNNTSQPVSNQLTSQPSGLSGSFVSTNYNTVSMQRKMEDLQNIGYLGMNNAEPVSDALTRELKVTTQIALLPESVCTDAGNHKSSLLCQDKNLEKAMAMPMSMPMPMVHDNYWPPQMTKNYSFWQNSDNSAAQSASK